MAKLASQIHQWGVIKPFFDKSYNFNTIDIETIDNELFLIGCTLNGKYKYYENDFYNNFHYILIESLQNNKDILTWSRYDNTHLVKLLLKDVKDVNKVLLKIGKVSPIYTYKYEVFTITITNIIKDSIILTFIDPYNEKSKNVVIYNLKNLYDTDLETTAKNYDLTYYSKLGVEYHIIDKMRYMTDLEYKKGVLKSNELDNLVLLDISSNMLENFKVISGHYPKSIFTNGSLARSYLLASRSKYSCNVLQFKSFFNKHKYFNDLLDYSMKSYHGGKIESYVLGYVDKAKIIDITSAYPYAMSLLPSLTRSVYKGIGDEYLENFYYAFIKCEIEITDRELIHPVIVENPINKSNISPYGYMECVITKIEYDYLISKGVKINVIDYIGIEHIDIYPYKEIVDELFNNRLETRKTNPSLSQMYKIILNSLYGITYELTDIYKLNDKEEIEWVGYRAGDFFNPIIASYITAITRTSLSEVSHDIVLNGGKVYLNMTDSIIYDGNVDLKYCSEKKILGTFEKPTDIENCMILGAGRYEYMDSFTKKYTIKSRGFSVSVKDKAFYSNLKLNETIEIEHKTFVSGFKATTKKFEYQQMGYLIDDTYKINPFNLGGKRVIENYNVNLNKTYTRTYPVYLEKDIIKKAFK